MDQGDRKALHRALINRLRRWCAIDAYAALQEPGLRDEYNARASIVSLLIDVMERDHLRSTHDAIVIIEEGIRTVDPSPPTSDAPANYRITDKAEKPPPTPIESVYTHYGRHNAITIPARPNKINTILPPPPKPTPKK